MGQVILLRLIEVLKNSTGGDHSVLVVAQTQSFQTHHMEVLF